MTRIDALLSSIAAEAIGWALLHLLWQGAVLALVVAAVLALMKTQSANARYLVACTSLLLLLALPVVTGVRVYRASVLESEPVRQSRGASIVSTVTTLDVLMSEIRREITGDSSIPLRQRLLDRLETLLPSLVAFWISGVLFLTLRLLFGWLRVSALTRGATEAPQRWQRTLESLSARLSLPQSIALLESRLVDVPMVIGWIRPVVLVPATALTGLSPDQLETILAHELAHIRRHDYLVNVIQSAVETLLFFHPGVWWLSRQIRIERENCCDDIAVAVCGNPVVYARALTELEGLRTISRQYALGANGGSLRERVVRLLSSPSSRCSYRWVTGASLISVLAAVAIAAPISLFAYQKATARAAEKPVASVSTAEAETPTHAVIDAVSDGTSIDVVAESAPEHEPETTITLVDDDGVDVTPPAAPIAPAPPHSSVHHFQYSGTFSPLTPAAPIAPQTPLTPLVSTTPVTPTTPTTPTTPSTPMTSPYAPRGLASPSMLSPLPSPRASLRPLPVAAVVASAPPLPRAPRAAVPGRIPGQFIYNDFDLTYAPPKPRKRWDGKLTVDQLIALRTAGVDGNYINELRSLGYGDLSFQEILELRVQGVSSKFISEMSAAGFTHLSAGQLAELRAHSIGVEFMDQLKKSGYAGLPLREVIDLKVHGVTSDYIKGMVAAGIGKPTAKQLLNLRIQGVRPEFIAEMVAAGVGSVNSEDLIELRLNGVTANLVKSLREAGFDKLSAAELIRLRVSGIDIGFLEEMKQYRKK
ncbi:MAG TPA: M56 family metallopeptidase [Thermoanaerobaculia bacterium]|nr:M56 family metallopeptidase [Thermoanaerobaculia bacterium]